MAETLTMEPNVEKTSIENLSEDEQNSLEVGEKMQQAQDNLLAGKYKNAEELEKGYLQLQQKLSNNNTQGEQAEPEAPESEPEAITTYINPDEVIKRLAAAQGIDVLNLVKSVEDVEQAEQQAMQQEAEMEAIKGTPALMKAPMLDPSKNQQGIQQPQPPEE